MVENEKSSFHPILRFAKVHHIKADVSLDVQRLRSLAPLLNQRK